MHVISVLGWIFSEHARKQPFLRALPAPRYEGGRRESCLHCEPDLRLTVTQLLRRDDSCLALQTLFFSPSSIEPSPICALRTVMVLTRRWTSLASTTTPRGKVSEEKLSLPHSLSQFLLSLFIDFLNLLLSQLLRGEQVIGAMSRKKAVKGKAGSKSPKASPSSGRTGKGLAAAAAPSSGLVYPSRPSLSNSGEFYDIAFKVSAEFRERDFFIFYFFNQAINY